MGIILRIEVIKGQAAAVLHGPRAAGGAILIITKPVR
jgi:outer membrane receptor for Fe3+-dicitrate